MPTALGKHSPQATDEERDKLLAAVAAIRSEAGVIVPEGMSVELLTSPGGASSLNYQVLHDTMDAAIAKIVLSQTMTTDDGSSLSQAQVHEGVGAAVAKSDADLICQSFNQGPVARLAAFNFPGVEPPRVWRKMEDPEDTTAAVARDKTLHDMGWRLTRDRLRETYGDGYERAEAGAGAPPEAPPPAFAEHSHDSALDRLAREIVGEGHAEAAAETLFADIAGFLEGLDPDTPLEAARARLDALSLAPGAERAMVDLLTEASFTARLAGEFGAVVDDEEAVEGADSLPGAVAP
jgi:hypothetical protein